MPIYIGFLNAISKRHKSSKPTNHGQMPPIHAAHNTRSITRFLATVQGRGPPSTRKQLFRPGNAPGTWEPSEPRRPVYFRPMATRRTPTSSPKSAVPRLRTTELPGVYLNADGAQVDERGVLLSLSQVRTIEADLDAQVLGEPVTSPALLLKRVALDARLPLSMRLSAAKDAAPYFDRKMPLAVEGGAPDRPLRVEQDQSTLLRGLSALPPDERKAALALLERIGAMG